MDPIANYSDKGPGMIAAMRAAGLDVLFRNNGDGTLTPCSTEAGEAEAFIAAYDRLPSDKTILIQSVKTLLAAKISAGFPYQGHAFQIDDVSQNHMVATMADFIAGNANAHGGYWRSAANVNVTMTATECETFLQAAKAYKMACIRNTQSKIDLIVAAANKAALDAVDITAGWP